MPCMQQGQAEVHRGSLGAQRRGKWRSIRSHSQGFGGNGGDDEGNGGRTKEFSGRIRNLGELVEEIFWGQNSIWDSKEYDKWLEEWSEEELEKELQELELKQVEYREFLKGLGEKQVEELVVVENEGEKNN